jgi:hypothetical protein
MGFESRINGISPIPRIFYMMMEAATPPETEFHLQSD